MEVKITERGTCSIFGDWVQIEHDGGSFPFSVDDNSGSDTDILFDNSEEISLELRRRDIPQSYVDRYGTASE